MNVIEAFFITLGLDTREYEKKQKEIAASLTKMGEVSGKQTKLIAESGKKAAGAFSLLKVEVLGALAAFGMGAGFKSFIESSMKMQVAAGRQAAVLGVSANSLQVWKQMAVEMGESGDAAVGTLNAVAQGLANARKGQMDWYQTAVGMGVKGLLPTDSTDAAMAKISEAAYKIKQKYGATQAANFLGDLGINDLAQQTQMMNGQVALAASYAHAKEHSVQLTQKEIAQNQKLLLQLGDLLGDFEKLKVKLENKLLPDIIKLGDQFEAWVKGGGLDRLTAKLEKFFDDVQKIVTALGGVKGILIEIAAIKVFGWIANIGMWVLKLSSLTGALKAARAAAAVGGATGAAAGLPGAATTGTKLLGSGLLLRSIWTAAWAPRPEESPEQFKARIDAQNKKFNAAHPGYEQSSYWDKWKTVFGIASSPAAHAAAGVSTSGKIDRASTDSLFAKLEKQNGLPSGILSSIYSAESSRGKNLVSPKGALGPFQFMPGTAAQYGLNGSDVFDTGKSAAAAATYLHNLIAQFHGNVTEAVAAYNWGPGNVQRNGMGALPKETSDYVSKVLGGVSAAYVGAKPTASTSGPHQSTTNSDVHIGTMNVNAPKATDANGIAKAIGKSLRSHPLIDGSVTALA